MNERDWHSTPMTALGNDLWSASFTVDQLGPWVFTIQAWVDHFDTWLHDLHKRLAAQPDPTSSDPAKRDLPPQDIPVAFNIGAQLSRPGSRAAPAECEAAMRVQGLRRLLRGLADKRSAALRVPAHPEIEAARRPLSRP